MSTESPVLAPGPLVTIAGLTVAAAGFLQAIAGYQLVSMVFTPWWWADIWMWVVCLTGIPLIPLGFGASTARSWATIPALLFTPLAGLVSGSWVIFGVLKGGFTAATVAAAGFCFMALVLSAAAAPRAMKVAKGRRELLKGL